jgi:hypothetical protein
MATRTAAWVLPTTYTDGSPILDQSKIVTHIYADGVEVGVSAAGGVLWSGEVASVQGQSIVFTAKCEFAGVDDPFSPASVEVTFVTPFLATSPPTGLSIT